MRALVLRDGLAVLVLVPVHEVPHDGLHQPVVKALDAQVEDQHITLVALLVQPYAMAAAVGSLVIRSTFRPAMAPHSELPAAASH
ncbi:hypothetical protein PC129_g21712 [Phytophthora cactorum]|uniref:Uncharacterized protein n=1 Tax=Phytophthora cactorum TaxID=29920 RepID=A0A8T1ATW8_9STRA|nr:hypothetical protein PC111_g24376 [Phytophthora cactorum]KAG2888807.1 hypothetical protein PC117_g24830 [Phytophthora cactorum]KAG2958085.1 hypothetical protein PC118_g23703 [Phytophthora cactorum]KAG3206564.1 hypothetical protein PC129_g21712 [Phytophthora cactorum]KAG4039594.1 hypothetical protein PC123_g24860 [Phytophthora cactorum]